jgi:hypothetical protein
MFILSFDLFPLSESTRTIDTYKHAGCHVVLHALIHAPEINLDEKNVSRMTQFNSKRKENKSTQTLII